MNVLVVGLNHKSAPIEVRERLAFDSEQTVAALTGLKSRFSRCEFVLLSTCNRVELYVVTEDPAQSAAEGVVEYLSGYHGIPIEDFRSLLYVHEDFDAVRHLLSVASSLDSMVVGENQIVGQVKESYRRACGAKTTGKILNRLFHCSFHTSKKVHARTSISSGRVSVAGVAVELATQLFADITSENAVVIGAGETGRLIVEHLIQAGCRDITIINRSLERAEGVAERFGVSAAGWNQLAEHLVEAQIVISSAAVSKYLFDKACFGQLMKGRKKGTVLIIDLAVPRNFEPSINELEDIYLYSIDELSEVAETNRRAREEDITNGLRIVYESAADFMDWLRARDIGPLIGKMREEFAQISQDELKRFFVGVRQEAPCRDIAEAMVHRIVNKLSHCVIKNVDAMSKEQGPSEAARVVHDIVQHAREISGGSEQHRETHN